MHGLVLFVVRAGPAHARQDVEAELAVGLGILDLLALRRKLGGFGIGGVVLEGPRRHAAEEVRLETGVHDAAVEAERRGEGRPHVADFLEFLPDGRFA